MYTWIFATDQHFLDAIPQILRSSVDRLRSICWCLGESLGHVLFNNTLFTPNVLLAIPIVENPRLDHDPCYCYRCKVFQHVPYMLSDRLFLQSFFFFGFLVAGEEIESKYTVLRHLVFNTNSLVHRSIRYACFDQIYLPLV